ncbi:MAG: hypothetical protein DRJ56_06410 [Thermoprotei archaeon]|nr:MAG: hypothetical protein DRJ56_06410 [Thermoprotei archaeon]
MEVLIRPMRPGDLDALVEFWADMSDDPVVSGRIYPPTEENKRKWCSWVLKVREEDEHQVLVAESNGQVIGYILFRIRTDLPLWSPHKMATIYDLYVRPDFRRKGVATELLARALEVMRSRGATLVMITALVANEPALRLYRKMGFRDFRLTLVKEL